MAIIASSKAAVVAVLLAVLAAAAVAPARAAPWDSDVGDPNGDSGYLAARTANLNPSRSRQALTPEAAEASSTSSFSGVYRAMPSAGPLSYATVEGDASANPNRGKMLVKPRARSAQDLPGRQQVNKASGAPQVPAIVMGTAAVAQTYEGATAIALNDAMIMNAGRRQTTVSNSMLTSNSGPMFKRVSPGMSVGTTAQPSRAMALSGMANGRVAMAQANSAVAGSIGERRDRWGNRRMLLLRGIQRLGAN